MPDVDALFEQFIERQLAGENPDPTEYMSQASETEREELADLLDAFLEQAPRQAWDPEAFRGSVAEQVVDRLDRSLHGSSGSWPILLPRLRTAAKLKRATLVERLADALGVSGSQEKVALYYNQMEQGQLDSSRVSSAVLDKLAEIVQVSVATLRKAGEPLDGGESPGAAPAAAVFARTATADPEYASPGQASPPQMEHREEDEVDRLFRGGAD
jgi:hypothetical protein